MQLSFDDLIAQTHPGWTSAQEERLQQKVDAFREVCRDLEDETQRLRAALAGKEAEYDRCYDAYMRAAERWKTAEHSTQRAEREAILWRQLYESAQSRRPAVPSETPVEPRLFKRLAALVHPDKWEGQPATTLAHELMVVLNALRDEGS